MSRDGLSYLDSVWATGGTPRLKRVFSDLALRDRPKALRLINDDKLRFPVLFILMADIGALNMFDGLNRRNLTAINICSRKIYKYDIEAVTANTLDRDVQFQTLKWMFDTGKDWGGPRDGHDPYDAVIDYTAALLITEYEVKEVLRDVADMIFRRNRQGLYIHDLVWGFFQTLDRDALAIVAGYLLTNNPKDAELAVKLLGIEAPTPMDRGEARKIYRQFLDWLNENKPYLYLTGEQFQMTSIPKHMDANREAKYLGKEISPRYRAPVEPLTEYEIECLRRYREAPPEDQALLADYSHKLRGRDALLWHEWIGKQTAQQVAAAKMTREVI